MTIIEILVEFRIKTPMVDRPNSFVIFYNIILARKDHHISKEILYAIFLLT